MTLWIASKFFIAAALATSGYPDLLTCWAVPTEDIAQIEVRSEAEDDYADHVVLHARPGGEVTDYWISPTEIETEGVPLTKGRRLERRDGKWFIGTEEVPCE